MESGEASFSSSGSLLVAAAITLVSFAAVSAEEPSPSDEEGSAAGFRVSSPGDVKFGFDSLVFGLDFSSSSAPSFAAFCSTSVGFRSST